ncbi:hypothetical protein [Roseicyclus amphidinii]|uniref:hypothetical protein n=1 Tax=Roseicyclus amphidinii TaxID=3034232 RepID=UPI0024E05323|nr:hypothetical protein [Roseicyclus sp. Amp-Y-6]
MIWPFRRKPAVVAGDTPHRLPAELVAAIETATITTRGEPDPEDGSVRTIVKVAGMGPFVLDGLDDAAKRIETAFEVRPEVAQKAAKLLASVAAREVRDMIRARHAGAGARPWVFDW